ncbi:hypothetical protein HS088_TW02G00128 [Tripterygium wilfordii]|uniref:ditrans,polycis-polyprenyl diphosphate synthase [(2E,6E)-farnesyldiphosphate specific] n=1 Tax=Tripterygium wilfordii TaxID=458696 RepID=A0A7J7DXK5_TRIWF|nr:hypothetical protein HS088_TW02G00128 [Tripterygium wilfordii]
MSLESHGTALRGLHRETDSLVRSHYGTFNRGDSPRNNQNEPFERRTRVMDFEAELQKVYAVFARICNLVVRLLWHCLHFLVSLWYFGLHIAEVLESYLISAGIFKRYRALNIHKLRYLAIVVESEDAYQISKVVQLLQWLADIGVTHVCLYDREGILKMSRGSILDKLKNVKLFEDVDENESLTDQQLMTLEFASFSDGKEGLAKAANLLFKEYLKLGGLSREQEEQIFTESHLTEALRTVGFKGPDPDLLLVYGPARCHLGFPAWRIRYTEIVMKNEKPRSLSIYTGSLINEAFLQWI